MRKTWTLLAAAVLALSLGLGGCGGGEATEPAEEAGSGGEMQPAEEAAAQEEPVEQAPTEEMTSGTSGGEEGDWE